MGAYPSAANQLRTAQMPDLADLHEKSLAMKSMQQQQQSQELALKQQQQAVQDEQTFMQAMQKYGGNIEQALPELSKSVSPKTFMGIQNSVMQQKKAQMEFDKLSTDQKKATLDMSIKRTERLGQLAGAITDQATYEQAIQQAAQEELVPQEQAQQWLQRPYDPATVKYLQQQAISAADQQKQMFSELQFTETKRHNVAMETKPTSDQAEFADFYRNYLEANGLPKNARHELNARQEFQKMKRTPVPGVDVPYSPEVEQQRTRINASRAQTNGLSPQQLSRVTSLASQFDTNPVVKQFNETANKAQTARQIVNAGLGGPGDLAMVYEFMKGLDPTSVVRESEYATAAKSGNIFSGAAARFNGYFKPQGGFLPDNVKRAFLQLVDQKLSVSQRQVKSMHEDFSRRVNKITGGQDGAEYLTDYSNLYSSEQAQDQTVINPYRDRKGK